MPDRTEFDSSLAYAPVEPAVLARWPEYHALLIVVRGLRGGPSDRAGDVALCRAEEIARTRLVSTAPEELPEIASWRDAYRSFGVKPRQGRSGVEALLRRVAGGLPRIDRLTGVARRPRRHLSAVELAAMRPHPARRQHRERPVHP